MHAIVLITRVQHSALWHYAISSPWFLWCNQHMKIPIFFACCRGHLDSFWPKSRRRLRKRAPGASRPQGWTSRKRVKQTRRSESLKTHTPQIWGWRCTPQIGGWIFKKHLFYSAFWRSLPKFGGRKLHPPNVGGMGFQGLTIFRLFGLLFWLFFDSFLTLFWLFFNFWAKPGAKRRREPIFRHFFRLWARRAQMTPCSRRRRSQHANWFYSGVRDGVSFPQRDKTKCNFSWELQLLNPLKLFGAGVLHHFGTDLFCVIFSGLHLPEKHNVQTGF